MSFVTRLRSLWGADESRVFKLAAWGVALSAAAYHYRFHEDKRPESIKARAAAAVKKDS